MYYCWSIDFQNNVKGNAVEAAKKIKGVGC
jgi:hypothetical protein